MDWLSALLYIDDKPIYNVELDMTAFFSPPYLLSITSKFECHIITSKTHLVCLTGNTYSIN